MTFSIAARCRRTGQFGVAAASSSPAVAARCLHARAGVGAMTTQNITDPRLGPQALDLMALGASAGETCAILQRTAPHGAFRQVTIVDAHGGTAGFSGARTLGTHAIATGEDVISGGNLLADAAVPQAIVAAFTASGEEADLGDRILAAMRAGLKAGGEAGPIRSVGMLLVDRAPWPVANLRVDWHDSPIRELLRIWEVWKPQMADYVTRALNPDDAPSYGVPGEE